jgi:hypothetical protein
MNISRKPISTFPNERAIVMKLKEHLKIARLELDMELDKLKYQIWNKGLLLWWYRLWIRQDKFHESLDIDPLAMMVMTRKQRDRYMNDLIRRRNIAYYKNLATC